MFFTIPPLSPAGVFWHSPAMPHISAFRPLSVPSGSSGPLLEELTLPVRGDTLAQTIYLSGLVPPPALCSGLGRCGRCRVRFLSTPPPPLPVEESVLSHHALDDGWRLACHRSPEPGMRVALPEESRYAALRESSAVQPAGTEALAVDLGTTSLHWRALASKNASPASGVEINPQMGAGSDVMSRLAHAAAPEGRRQLSDLVRASLKRLCSGLGSGLKELCVAANPAMTYILLDKDCSGLAHAPYHLDYKGGRTENLPGLPPVWIPPQISPFVGGDVVAGYSALTFSPEQPAPRFPFLLADLGTNGEYILALSEHEALAASVPLGPALEGINLTLGTEARPGAVTAFAISPLGLEPQTLGNTAPKGISGTGYLSLLRVLIKVGVLTREGHFAGPGQGPAGGLSRRMGTPEAGAGGEPRLRLPGRLFLTASDVEELLKVKAAFSLAVDRLLHTAGLAPSSLKAVYLAGTLGTHVPVDALDELGFLPPGLGSRVLAVGNSSLAGADLFLRAPAARDSACAWAGRVRTLDLATDPAFAAAYADHMTFSWKS